MDGWMDGWWPLLRWGTDWEPVALYFGHVAFTPWPQVYFLPPSKANIPPGRVSFPTQFSQSVMSPSLPSAPTSTSSLIPILPIPEAEPCSVRFRQLPFPEAHHPSRWVPEKISLSRKVGYSSQSMTGSRPPKAQQRTCVVGREGEGEMNRESSINIYVYYQV